METVVTVIFILTMCVVLYFTFLHGKWVSKNTFVPMVSKKQINELLNQRGPANIADAFTIFEENYSFSFTNVLKAASILGDASGPDEDKAVEYLITNLNSSQPSLVIASAISLGKLKNPKALPALDKWRNTQPKSSDLEREKSLRFQKTQQKEYARRIGAILEDSSEIPSVTELYKKVKDSANWAVNEIRQNIERIQLSDSLSTSDSFKVLNSPEIFYSQTVYKALLRLGEVENNEIPRAINLLISKLTNPDPMVVQLSVVSLGKIGDDKALSALKNLSDITSLENGMLTMFLNDSIEKISLRKKQLLR